MSYEAVLMDMDGVLIDTQESIIAFWQRLASEHHIHLSKDDIDQHISGRSAQYTISTLLSHLNEQEQQAAYRALHDYEASLQYQEVSGAIALLKELKRYYIPVALVTGAGQWKAGIVVQQLGLESFLTAQVTGDDIQKSKPAPDSFLLAAHRLGKQPQSCIVFEDAVNGVLAARAAQAICVGVQTTAPVCALMAAGACCTIPDFSSVRVQATPSTTDEAGIFLHIGVDVSFPLKSSL